MKCSECHFENRTGAKFCGKCGAKLVLLCPQCSHENTPGNNFCDECGFDLKKPKKTPLIDYSEPKSYTPRFLADKILNTRSSIEGERKLVTVLFTDVAGYTSMSEKLDPEEVHQVMDGCFKIHMDAVHMYEGTINQFTGDGVMAIFGAPVSHEDHARRACHSALYIQKTMTEYGEEISKTRGVNFKIRIGLNSGPVVVGSIGDNLRMDYTAVGDTTNLASRMESMCIPGAVLVSRNTYKMARDFFEFEPLGKVNIKGKKEPQEVYNLLKAGELETRIEASIAKGLTRFVGREKLIDALVKSYQGALSGSGQVVGMVGEAGVGKSRVLFELKNLLPESEFTYLEGRCSQYGGNMAYMPILNILKSYFQIKKDDREIIIKKKIEGKVHGLDEKLQNTLPPLFEIFSLKIKDEAYLQMDPGLKKIRVFEAVCNLFIRESQNKPLIVAVEDLHWIDKTTEEFLDYLIGWIPNTRILLILLYRPEYTHQWGSKSYYTRLGVAQLPRESSIELVQAILKDGKLESELQNLILGRTGGNPLFAEELTLNLMENGYVEKQDDTYVLSGKTADIRVPDSIQGIIAARIDRLNESLKGIMQIAAVIGREFAFHILQAITGMKEELKSGLFSLQGMEFISEKRLFPELEYLFKHALTQEVAYNSLLLKKRREIHEKIGNATEELYAANLEEHYELLAYHYRRSANAQKALEYLDLANQKAIKLNAVKEGIAYFDEAMGLLDTMPENKETQRQRLTMLVNQYSNFFLLFKFSEYLDLLNKYEPAAVSLGNPQILGMYYVRIAQCLWWSGQLDQVLQKGPKAYKLCEEAGNLEGAGSASLMLQWSYLYKGDFHKVLELKENSLCSMKKQFNLRQYVWTLSVVSHAHLRLCHWEEALKEGMEGLRTAEKFADRSMTSFAAHTISAIYLSKGDLTRAKKYAELSSREAPTPADKAWSQSTLANVRCLTGETGKGVKVLETLAKMAHDSGNAIGEVDNLLVLGEGYNLAGDYDRAKQVLEECLELAKRCGMKFFLAEAHRLLGENYLETDPSRAESYFTKSLDIFKKIEAKKELAKNYNGFGLLCKHQGQITRARGYFKEALDIFDLIGISKESEKIKTELARISHQEKQRKVPGKKYQKVGREER